MLYDWYSAKASKTPRRLCRVYAVSVLRAFSQVRLFGALHNVFADSVRPPSDIRDLKRLTHSRLVHVQLRLLSLTTLDWPLCLYETAAVGAHKANVQLHDNDSGRSILTPMCYCRNCCERYKAVQSCTSTTSSVSLFLSVLKTCLFDKSFP